ncbi:hypothetical protein G4B88_023148, partial [Cannabis sativa]
MEAQRQKQINSCSMSIPRPHNSYASTRNPDGLSDLNVSSKNFVSVLSDFNITCKIPLQEALTQMVKTDGHLEKSTPSSMMST